MLKLESRYIVYMYMCTWRTLISEDAGFLAPPGRDLYDSFESFLGAENETV
jgi:hypothetical protein